MSCVWISLKVVFFFLNKNNMGIQVNPVLNGDKKMVWEVKAACVVLTTSSINCWLVYKNMGLNHTPNLSHSMHKTPLASSSVISILDSFLIFCSSVLHLISSRVFVIVSLFFFVTFFFYIAELTNSGHTNKPEFFSAHEQCWGLSVSNFAALVWRK